MTIPFSILDLCPVTDNSGTAQALRNTLDLAQHAERFGYHRYWMAEHHNMTGVASAATSVLIGYVAGGTQTIRVGSGGIMLPNHAPLVIAEQFGTLASLYPGRIDLGVGRAPGTDGRTMQALRRSATATDTFPQDVRDLQFYFDDVQDGQFIQAVPGAGLHVPIWILGSSLFGAQLAAAFGLPFAFASHFMPDHLVEAVHVYRTHFQPSDQLDKPYVMLAMNVFAADTDAEAQLQFTSLQQQFYNLRFATPGRIPKPVANITDTWHHLHRAGVNKALACSAVGSRDTVRNTIQNFITQHQPDELMLTGTMYDHAARVRSFEIAADVMKGM